MDEMIEIASGVKGLSVVCEVGEDGMSMCFVRLEYDGEPLDILEWKDAKLGEHDVMRGFADKPTRLEFLERSELADHRRQLDNLHREIGKAHLALKEVRTGINPESVPGMVEALKDIENRAKRIREDKAVVGIEASFIERTAREALDANRKGQ